MAISKVRSSQFALCWILVLSASAYAYDGPEKSPEPVDSRRQFTFAWPFLPGANMAPRGGSTVGEEVALVVEPSPAWIELQAPGLSAKERDRKAILAMAGAYRASFDFIETVGFTVGYEPDVPYQSWGTEYIYVVADTPDFISLQHIMVIQIAATKDNPSSEMVIKHWRQDWRYQPDTYVVFNGHRQWQRKTLSQDVAQGRWVQSVYQVDDSPRYAAVGRWQHNANYSSWTSEETWRP
ncbi:MAG: hypothetical protein HRT77_17040, partial [Halioglobus sp.]|nr:hypothetical protein [Halioglobus sp.]